MGSEREENICYLTVNRLQPTPIWTGDVTMQEQNADSRQLICSWKDWFQWAQVLVFSHTYKSAKFLCLNIWFPLISSQCVIQTSCPFVGKFYITWFPNPHKPPNTHLPQRKILQGYLGAPFQTWSLKNSYWMKQLSTFRLWLYILSCKVGWTGRMKWTYTVVCIK